MLSFMKRSARGLSCRSVKLCLGKAVCAFLTSCLMLILCSQRQHACFFVASDALPSEPWVVYAAWNIPFERRVWQHFSQSPTSRTLSRQKGHTSSHAPPPTAGFKCFSNAYWMDHRVGYHPKSIREGGCVAVGNVQAGRAP
jgi:hypothetical protein